MIDVDHLDPYLLQPVGIVRSKLKPAFADGLDGITPGCEVVLLTWFHKARRNVLKLHPRDNPKNPLRGVFTTRSSNRPNPVGLHRVEVLEVDMEGRLRVRPLEALNGTPIIDIKPILRKSLDV
jgi:tRNA-Thr(GGU) m(6)t(6)A37 methyltransferase TsaA